MPTTARLFPTALILPLLAACSMHSKTSNAANTGALAPSLLRCEYLTNPLGINEIAPRLSWMLSSSRRGDRQAAYQVLVASSPELLAKDHADLWDSGKVNSDENAHVVYAGKPLASRTACFWKVRVWSPLDPADGNPAWSEPAFFTVGLLSPADWHAQWIDSSAAINAANPTPPIHVLHAVYASTKGPESLDVTDKLADRAKTGDLALTVANDAMGGDPAPNTPKKLTITYEQNGKTITQSIAENKSLGLSNRPTRLWNLRKSFAADKPIAHATLYATALGLYEIHLNGQRVGDHVLAPDWTDYAKRVRYQTYDVTPLLTSGTNALLATLANGWYAGHLGNGGYQQYGKTPALLAQLEITYTDGTTATIATNASWKTAPSSILASDFMLGESEDGRQQHPEQAKPRFDDSSWAAATVREEKPRQLDSQVDQPVRETQELHPIAITEPTPGHYVFDLGQNMVGVVRLHLSAKAGTTITLHHAEMLNPDGTLYTTNLRGAPSIDTYICRGGEETWQPHFTFHGFRYVELTGLPTKPTKDAITGIVLGTDTPLTGSFTCSDPRINQLFSNIEWGQRGNYLSIPTDCPQRDERLGWMGDAQVFVRTATDNADVAAFFTKWLVDVDDAQKPDGAFTDVSPFRGSSAGTPAWGDAGVICPWTIYLAYGDKRILERHLPAMTRWIEWCRTHSTNLLRENKKDRGADYGDWLSIGAETPKDVIGTAYFAYSTHLVAKSYEALGNTEQAAKYNQLFNDIKAAFNKAYVSADGHIKGDTQSCYDMALKFDLLPDTVRPLTAKLLDDDIHARHDHLSTGFVGVSYLLPTLTAAGDIDTAYKLLFQDTFPSWLFSVKHGATTIWERWDGWTPDKGFQNPGMNSFNHYSLGSCGEWLYDTVAGISWDEQQPGYKHILLNPTPGPGLTSAKATIRSPYGDITSDWKLDGHTFTLHVTIPPNTTASLTLPDHSGPKHVEVNSGTSTFTSNP